MYSLSHNSKESIRSKTGKTLKDITIENIMKGKISADDIKISKEALKKQGDIAKKHGRQQMQQNFNRASELTEVPDELILEIYDKLRPYRATKQELLEMARTLKNQYGAIDCGKMIEESALVYEKRGILKT
ncbi:propanediol dehydratase small subunit [Natronincola peptidivorans]|uniref:Propanediol dehydratase small subunit n=2 Tax=Natronincola peptidivorans TaxID=426128 RepID=A0A1I0CGG9_9FIRM|nr:propanediol dehydratase small subunit [Natronincola peptidivorans]